MLRSHHKCATAIYCFCDLKSLSPVFKKLYHNLYLKKAVGETYVVLWSDQETFVYFHFFNKLFSKMGFLAMILDKTAEYYCLTIIDHSCVISFWYSSNIVSP